MSWFFHSYTFFFFFILTTKTKMSVSSRLAGRGKSPSCEAVVVSVLLWCCRDVIALWQHPANIVNPLGGPVMLNLRWVSWGDQTPGGEGSHGLIYVSGGQHFHLPLPSIPPSFCPSLSTFRHTPYSQSNLFPFVSCPGLWCRETVFTRTHTHTHTQSDTHTYHGALD